MRAKKIDIGIKSLKESLKDFSTAWGKMASGEKIKKEKSLYFDSIDTMRAILTNKRLLILKTVREQSPSSVYELAKMLGRDLKNVNQDLKLLAEVGLVTLEKKQTDKKRVIPHVEYSKILLEIPV
jgi:predicted transcriptional regulator